MRRLVVKNVSMVALAVGLTYLLDWGTRGSPFHWLTWLFAVVVLTGTVFWLARSKSSTEEVTKK